MLQITPRLKIPLQEFEFSFVRSSGPGGQNVNKVNSKAVLRWPVMHSPSLPDEVRSRLLARQRRRITAEGELVITGQRFRDAPRNMADCIERLRAMLLEAASPPAQRKPTRPSRGSVRRRLEDKQRQARKKSTRRAASDD